MGRTIGRRVVDIAQKSRGRSALRYELEVIPYFCGDIPDGVERCSFAWERGTKVYVTEAEPVNPQSHAVFWKQYLRQAATMYRDSKEAALLPKEYAFKVQAVKSGDGGKEKRRTVGKLHLNMAQFCTDRMDAKPQEMMLQLKPSGKLKVSIKATWLRDARIDHDAMTEVTAGGRSEYTEDASYYDEDEEGEGGEGGAGYLEEEQDLSGFDPETGQPLPGRRGGGRSGGGADEGYGEEGQGEGEEWEGGEGHRRSRRHGRSNGTGSGPSEGRAMRRGRRQRTTQPLHDPDMAEEYGEQYGEGQGDGGGGEYEGGEGAEAGEGGRRGRKGRRGKSSHAASVDGGPEGGTGGPGSGGGGGGGGTGLKHFDMAAGRQVHRAGWRDYLCCCLPRRGPAEDPQEGDSLLAAAAAAGPGGGPPLDVGDGGGGGGGGGGGRRSSRRDRGRDRERTRDREREREQEY